MTETFVVVGGDAAGMSAASKARRENPDLEIIVFERGRWVSYGACGLPYYVKGDIERLEDLVAIPPEDFVRERDIDLRRKSRVTKIDPGERTVSVETDGTSTRQRFDHLLIATGARAVAPPVEGVDQQRVFTLHDMEDARRIRRFVREKRPRRAALIGGGYIGLEMAEALAANGVKVLLFEQMPHVLGPFGEATARVVEEHLRKQRVDLHLEAAVQRIAGGGGVAEGIVTPTNSHPVDMVLLGTGVRPRVDLAEEAGIELGPTGAIATDRYGRTSHPAVYAGGDCAEARHVVTGEPDHVPLALTANRFGRAIGRSIGGETPVETGPIAGTALVKVFELEVARTGLLDEERMRHAGFEPVSYTVETESRAHYYPGGSTLRITLTADRTTGRVLGAGMVGREGVAQRIDVVAAALHERVTLDELERWDLAYSPPFGPAWDPVLTAAKVLNGRL